MHSGTSFTVLIIGGYGTFGGRLVELLEGEPRLTLIVAGRSRQKAEAYCRSRGGVKAQLVPAIFDRAGDIGGQLAALKPGIVVDASGPFQDYGGDAYNLITACIAAGIHYLDLADGSEFVAGVAALDDAARKAGVFALSGVSSFPVLTAAVGRKLSTGMARVTSIRGGIAPSPYAGVGINVIRAIASYAGQEITLKQAGKTVKAWPLTSSLRYTVATPGRVPLRNKLFSLVDVPDLRVLADIWPEATIWMGAGPVPEILHRMLILFAWPVRLKLIKSLLPIANLMEIVIRHVRWGEHRGGMFIEVGGTDATGVAVIKSWHLLAEGRDGPLIPSMAVACLVRRLLAGGSIAPGARAALSDITLDDYDALFSTRTIYSGVRQDVPKESGPLYKDILGTAWGALPPVIREMHDVTDKAEAEGIATVRRGSSPLANFACRLLGFPKADENIPVRVAFTVKDGVETWTRTFNGESFHSVQSPGRGRAARLVVERFGILRFAMAVDTVDGKLNLVLRRWSVLGIPLPMFLCARSESFEFVDAQGRFNFDVRISHPLTGLIVHYTGWLLRKA